MATKPSEKLDAQRGQKRFLDQPGQWRDVTPKSVKKRQSREWRKLAAMMKK